MSTRDFLNIPEAQPQQLELSELQLQMIEAQAAHIAFYGLEYLFEEQDNIGEIT